MKIVDFLSCSFKIATADSSHTKWSMQISCCWMKSLKLSISLMRIFHKLCIFINLMNRRFRFCQSLSSFSFWIFVKMMTKILSTRLLLMKIARVVLKLLLSILDIFDVDLRVLSKMINSEVDEDDLKMKNALMLLEFNESEFI